MPTALVPISAAAERDEQEAGPSRAGARAFAEPPDPDADEPVPDLATVVRRVRAAKRIVVICGAGVSTAAAIPDFRSASGLFSGSKGHGIKDLFHIKSLSSAALLPDHHALLTDLCERATSADPTSFHHLLATLDNDGRLLRCYTQNIDGLEARAGLATGIPLQRSRSRKGKERASASVSAVDTPVDSPIPESEVSSALGDITPNTEPPSHPPAPRCIPLHGLLDNLHCSLCSTKVPITTHLPLPPQPIPCPTCDLSSSLRSALSERQRRVGTLRASVVLYGEEHPEGDLIGAVVERDLRGTGRRGEREGKADLLLVAGTSLAIPGVKRIVKEMAKSLSLRTDTSVRDGKAAPIRTVFVNSEPPAKTAEWDGVFDVWARGDVQEFAALVADDSFAPALPTPKRTPRKTPQQVKGTPTKIKAEEDTGLGLLTPEDTPSKPRKRKVDLEEGTPTKKRKAGLPLTPRPTPPRPRDKGGKESSVKRESSSSSFKVAPRKEVYVDLLKRARSPSPSPSTSPRQVFADLPPCSTLRPSTPERNMDLDVGHPRFGVKSPRDMFQAFSPHVSPHVHWAASQSPTRIIHLSSPPFATTTTTHTAHTAPFPPASPSRPSATYVEDLFRKHVDVRPHLPAAHIDLRRPVAVRFSPPPPERL